MTYRIHSTPDSVETSEGQRPCARGDRCLQSTAVRQDDGSWQREPALGYRTLCDSDRTDVASTLEALPETYVALYLMLGDKPGGSGPKVSGSKDAPTPNRLDVHDLMAEVVDVISSWDERVRTAARLSGPDTQLSRSRRAGVALSTMCRTLTDHLDVLLALPKDAMARDEVEDMDGGDAALEILGLHRRCRSTLGLTRRHKPLLVPCDGCGWKALVQWDGATGFEEGAYCTRCGYEYSDNEYTLLRGRVYERELAREKDAS